MKELTDCMSAGLPLLLLIWDLPEMDGFLNLRTDLALLAKLMPDTTDYFFFLFIAD